MSPVLACNVRDVHSDLNADGALVELNILTEHLVSELIGQWTWEWFPYCTKGLVDSLRKNGESVQEVIKRIEVGISYSVAG